MPTFGVIAEGPTDQVVIENILIGYFDKCEDDVVVRYVQPPPPLGENPAGWSLVFKCLERKDHEGALQYSDFLIIHIDTDVQEEEGYGVSRREQGRELSVAERITRVIARLQRDMGADFLQANGQRVLYAIAVDSIECWLLPLHDEGKASKITGCLDAVNKAIRRSNGKGLSSGEKKFIDAYETASSQFRKRKRLIATCTKNPSLTHFVSLLDSLFANQNSEQSAEKAAAPPSP